MDDTISSIVLLIGMAVGVDYTLFYLRREREERRRGATGLQAIDTAAATSGRAVLISGFTVIAAMAGMFLAGDKTFTSLGVGSIIVVAVAMIGSLTVVPAVLAALGDKVDKGRVPLLHRVVSRGDGRSRAWDAILERVLRRPAVSAVAAVTLLVVLALPALGMHTVQTGTDDLPRKLEVMRVYDRMQAAFPGGQIPATVAVTAPDVTTPQLQAAIRDLERQAVATGTMNAPGRRDRQRRPPGRRGPPADEGRRHRQPVGPRRRRAARRTSCRAPSAASTARRRSSPAWPPRRRTGTA